MMPWRWRWPPWVPERLEVNHRDALEQVERSTVDLADTRRSLRRAERIADSLRTARARNHFSESMETLFAPAPRGHHGPQQHGG